MNKAEMEVRIAFRKKKKDSFDIPMFLISAALVLLGCLFVYSASSVYALQYHDDKYYFILRHLAFLALSLAVGYSAVKFGTPQFWKKFGKVLYFFSLVLLILVLLVGDDLGSGAKRWLNFKLFTVQPSEIAKTGMVLMLAAYFSEKEEKITFSKKRGDSLVYGLLIPGAIIASVGGLIALEHHISGLMIIGGLGVAMMYLGGTKLKWILSLAGIVVLAGAVLVLVSDYAQTRVDTWLHIEQVDPLGEAWQTLQGLMAIGSGGVFGTGFGKSRQKYGYVSQPQNDFIFTVICEELGFFGAALVILLFFLFVRRGFYIAKHSTDRCSALIVYGLSFKVALQVILNLGVVTNSMPNTGISLPLFSYGGTSLLLQIFEIAIILSLSAYSTQRKI